MAKAHQKAGKWEKAIEAYEMLLKRNPKSAYVLHALTAVYDKKGDVEKVKEFETELKEACQYADKGMYGVKRK